MKSIYTERLAKRCVRILALHPGSGPNPINMHLQEASIDDPPPFEALSYVWGDPSQRDNIQCAGQPISVTKSLFDALRHFRLPDRELLIWADALCINQDDVEERAEQVQLMREIYSRAERVVVWLGPDERGEAARAISLVEAVHRACEDQALAKGVGLMSMAHFTPAEQQLDGLAGVSMEDVAAVAGRMGRLKPDGDSWAALGWLLSRPWFTRVWCVQEIVLAKSSRAYVGSYSFDWVKLGVTAAWLSEQNLANDYNVPAELEGLSWDNAYSMFDTIELSESNLLQVLVTFRDFNATDSRDKVYGLLGLVNDAALEGFSGVDYKKSAAEVYTDVVKTSVSTSGNLASLCYVKHGVEYEPTEFPSWVPRWDTSEDACSILHSLTLIYWEDGEKHGLPGMTGFNPSADGKLALSGVRFDTITWITEVFNIEHFKEEITPWAASNHPCLELWHRASSNKCYALYPSSEDSVTAVLQMALTLTAGFNDVYKIVIEGDSDDRLQFYADYLAFTRHLFDLAEKNPSTYDPLEISLCERDASRFRIAASRNSDQRRVFETEGGFYGLGPACVKEGDVVVMLYGAPIPLALRQVKGGWILLGESYVAPLMPESADDDIRKLFGNEEVFVLR